MELTGIQALSASLVSGFSDVATDILAAIGSILPILIPIVGGIALITVGYKVFKKFGH